MSHQRLSIVIGPLRHVAVCCGLILIGPAGCTTQAVAPSDVGQATQLLRETLDAWVAGESVAAQRAKQPSVYVAEDLWLDGAKLASYRLNDSGVASGPNIRFNVTLVCAEGRGPAKERTYHYVVTTTPALTIARQDY